MWDKSTTKYFLQGAPSLKKINPKQIPPLKKTLKNQTPKQQPTKNPTRKPKPQQLKTSSAKVQPVERCGLKDTVQFTLLVFGDDTEPMSVAVGAELICSRAGLPTGPWPCWVNGRQEPKDKCGGCTWKGRTPCSLLDCI